jgi:hypothetical protein
MKFAKVTKTILRFFAALHCKALRADCACTERATEKQCEIARHQLQLVAVAKERLQREQSKALLSMEEAELQYKRTEVQVQRIERMV